jgi:alpha,alpha-trehalase
VLILDYDGTLTPVMPSPDAAALAPSVRRVLRRLAVHPRVRVAVLSGRSLRDVRARVGVAGVIYGGCHGLEIAGPGLRFRHPAARPAALRAARRALAVAVAGIPGVVVEDKRITVCVHYRRVPRQRHREVLAAVARARHDAPGLVLLEGKRVAELLPRAGWGKGQAARWIAARARPARRRVVVYAGDDRTDEAAFAALRGRAITVRVGAGRGGAAYAVPDVRAVTALLRWLARAIASGGRGARDSRGGGG